MTDILVAFIFMHMYIISILALAFIFKYSSIYLNIFSICGKWDILLGTSLDLSCYRWAVVVNLVYSIYISVVTVITHSVN